MSRDDDKRKSKGNKTKNQQSTSDLSTHLDDDKSKKDESQCYICLNTRVNSCYADNCLHQFCTNCLLEWSRNSDQCPVCRTTFENLLINVISDSDYETIPIQPNPPVDENVELESLLDIIITEITGNIPDVATYPGNIDAHSSGQVSPERPREDSSNTRTQQDPSLRGVDLTSRSHNENYNRWRRVSRDRRRQRRPRLISKSTVPNKTNSSASSSNENQESSSSNNDEPTAIQSTDSGQGQSSKSDQESSKQPRTIHKKSRNKRR